MDTTFAAEPVSCYAHLDVASTVECARCDRHLCDVCAFESAASKLSVDCMTEGAGHSGDRKTIGYSVAALVRASLGVVTLGIPFFGLHDLVALCICSLAV